MELINGVLGQKGNNLPTLNNDVFLLLELVKIHIRIVRDDPSLL